MAIAVNVPRLKYVIAREGLIILSMLLAAAIAGWAGSWQRKHIDHWDSSSQVHYLKRKLATTGPEGYQVGNPVIAFPKTTSLEVIVGTLVQKYPAYSFDEWQPLEETHADTNARYDANGNKLFTGFPWNINFDGAMTFFLFIAYPAYLIGRFIAWAAVTVIRGQGS